MKVVIVLFVLFAGTCHLAAQPLGLRSFPLQNVRLSDGPFKKAQDTDLKYILEHDADRFLAPFLKEAGLEPKAGKYGNWENTGLDGHSAGHYLSALSLMYAASGNEECLRRSVYMVDELARCQDKNGMGYVGGVPDSKPLWEEIKSGKIKAESFSLNRHWVPWYNLHKTYAGLCDAYVYTGNEKAKQVLVKLCDWAIDLTSQLSDKQIQDMLRTEHGGMNEVFADVAALTGESKYLALARRFSHRMILDPLVAKEDRLNGMHANTQIPKVIGFKRIADLDHDTVWSKAAAYFWDNVVNHRTVSIGGNSVREHFHPANDFSSMIESNQGPETCNTYNMLKLSRQFYLSGDGLKYIDFYEQALFNHILSSQHPLHGGLVYFTPMRPQHYRVYSKAETAFWCCVGTGMENHAKYGELIYAHNENQLFVNLFIASRLEWKEKGISMEQLTNFPEQAGTMLKLNLAKKTKFTLNVRCPQWSRSGEVVVRINGRVQNVATHPGHYISLNRKWSNGDVVELITPMHLSLHYLPDKSKYASLMYGPIVLAAATDTSKLDGLIADDSRMGHVANGRYYPLEEAPMLVFENNQWESKVKRVGQGDLVFDASDLIYPESRKGLRLIPFYKLHDARYMVYWQCATPGEIASIREKIKREQEAMMELELRTLDQVAPGEQQPESDHGYQGENTNSGVHQDRHWRDASGWFSYYLNSKGVSDVTLRITYFGLDRDRRFDILINDMVLATVHLDGSKGNSFYDVDYQLSDAMLKQNSGNKLKVTFRAHDSSIAGGIYYVRLLK